MLRLKCLLLESSKSNFAKEIHYGKWNPHEPFFVTSSRAPLSQFVMAMYSPSQSYSGAFLLSFICNINRNDGNVDIAAIATVATKMSLSRAWGLKVVSDTVHWMHGTRIYSIVVSLNRPSVRLFWNICGR